MPHGPPNPLQAFFPNWEGHDLSDENDTAEDEEGLSEMYGMLSYDVPMN